MRTTRQATKLMRGVITWRCEEADCGATFEMDDTDHARRIQLPPNWWSVTSSPETHSHRPTVWEFCSKRCCLLATTAALLADTV